MADKRFLELIIPSIEKEKEVDKILDQLDLKISRLHSFSENCRLDLAVPYSIGISRTVEILYRNNEITEKEYDKMNRDVEEAVSRSHRCFCIHPMSIFA